MKRIAFVKLSLFVIVALAFLGHSSVSATTATQLAPAINESSRVGVGEFTYDVFYDQTVQVSYNGGPACVSARSDSCSPPAIDDAVSIEVNGTQAFYHESYTNDFAPVDLSGSLHSGSNTVRVQLIDLLGPSRGGSALWLVFGGSTSSNALIQITSVSPSKSTVDLNEPYTLNVTLHNMATYAQSASVAVAESGALTAKGDAGFSSGLSVVLGAGESRTISVGPIKHYFRWFSLDEGCSKVQTLIKEVAQDLAFKYLKLDDIGRAYDVLDKLVQIGVAVASNAYHYTVSVASGGGTAENATQVVVNVPGDKAWRFMESLVTDVLWPGVIAAGLLASADPMTAPVGADWINAGYIAWQESCRSKANALDPDPDYTQIAVPAAIQIPPSVAALADGQGKQMVLDLLRLEPDQDALSTALGRFEAAKADGANDWAAKQMEAARLQAVRLQYDYYLLAQTFVPLASGVDLSANLDRTKLQLQIVGLPDLLNQLMTSDAVASTEIDNTRQALLALIDGSAGAWPAIADSSNFTGPVLQTFVGYAGGQVSNYRGSAIDQVPPTSTISATGGKMGLQGWYTSGPNVSVQASDNAGGSGLKSVEWSRDFGRTWNNYVAPVPQTDGINRLISRAADMEGNIQFPPTRLDVKVDSVKPRTGISLSYSVNATSTGTTIQTILAFPCDDTNPTNHALETSGCAASYYSFVGPYGPFTSYTNPFVKELISLPPCVAYSRTVSYSPYLYSIDAAGNKANPARVTASTTVSYNGKLNCATPTPTPAPSCTITLNSSSLTLSGSSSLTLTVKAKSTGGFSSPVTLSITGLPIGVTASFSPSTVTPTSLGASSSLKLTAAQPPKGQSTNVTISGSTGAGLNCAPANLAIKT